MASICFLGRGWQGSAPSPPRMRPSQTTVAKHSAPLGSQGAPAAAPPRSHGPNAVQTPTALVPQKAA